MEEEVASLRRAEQLVEQEAKIQQEIYASQKTAQTEIDAEIAKQKANNNEEQTQLASSQPQQALAAPPL